MSYGQQVVAPPPPPEYGGQVRKSNGLAVAGFVLALLGALGCWVPFVNIFFALLAILGLVFGAVGLVTSGRKGAGKGLSIAAIALAVPALVISVVVSVAAFGWVQTRATDFVDAQKSAAPVTGKTGQPVRDGQLTFVVRSVKCGMKTYGESLPDETLGEFCVVSISVSNHGQRAKTLDDIKVEGFIAGSRYEANSAATADANADPNAKPDPFPVEKPIKPGGLTQIVVLVDVPVGQQLDTVELHDSPFSDGTSVSVR
jgi:hypothetical protein